MKNPFQFGGTLRPEEIIHRQSEIKQIVQTIQESEKLFLIGPRRYGKTTILHAARQQCEARGGRVNYLNAEAYNNLSKLAARLFALAPETLIRFPLKAKATIREARSRFKPTLSVDLLSNKVTGSISFDATAREQPMPSGMSVTRCTPSSVSSKESGVTPTNVGSDSFNQRLSSTIKAPGLDRGR